VWEKDSSHKHKVIPEIPKDLGYPSVLNHILGKGIREVRDKRIKVVKSTKSPTPIPSFAPFPK
jgi:hypothetical protein